MFSWRRAAGATRYIITITISGRKHMTLSGLASVPTVTLKTDAALLLAPGAVSRISIRGVNLDGREGPTGTLRYSARRGGRAPARGGRTGDAFDLIG